MKKNKKEIIAEIAEEPAPIEIAEEVVDTSKVEASMSDSLSEYDHKMIDNDIKYRGPLSYRHFRMIGWLALTIAAISTVVGVAATVALFLGTATPEDAQTMSIVSEVMSFFQALPLPLFLIANFAVILQGKNKYKKLLMTYGGIFLAIYIGFLIVYYHYVVMLIMKVAGIGFVEAREKSVEYLASVGAEYSLVVNVFVDLFMCVLIMFFIDYTPTKIFTGKKIIIFRLLAILPIVYEILSAVLMGLLSLSGKVEGFVFALPAEILPMIGKKPVGMIIAFILVCIYIKLRKRRYLKKGGTEEGYQLYEQTNRNSFKFARVMSLIFFIVALVDLIVSVVGLVLAELAFPEDPETAMNTMLEIMSAFTISKSVCLILVIPFILLFSYLKQHKNPGLDKFVPIGGIVFLIFAVFESAFISILLM